MRSDFTKAEVECFDLLCSALAPNCPWDYNDNEAINRAVNEILDLAERIKKERESQ